MKVLKFIITILVILTLKTYAQDSLGGKFHFERRNKENQKVIVITSPPSIKISREFKFNSIVGKENEILSPSLQLGGLKKDENFIDSPWFKVVVGTAISFGASAAYFKNKANNSDELYKKNGTIKDLNNRNKYDTYGGIALGALELNVGFLIYKFLTD